VLRSGSDTLNGFIRKSTAISPGPSGTDLRFEKYLTAVFVTSQPKTRRVAAMAGD
jgi:hypothetical protein